MSGIGHNVGGIAADQLKAFIERVEKLEADKAAIATDIREVFAEAKAVGFKVKIMRQIIRLRNMDSAERDEQQHYLDLYKRALGMQPSFDFDEAEDASE